MQISLFIFILKVKQKSGIQFLPLYRLSAGFNQNLYKEVFKDINVCARSTKLFNRVPRDKFLQLTFCEYSLRYFGNRI